MFRSSRQYISQLIIITSLWLEPWFERVKAVNQLSQEKSYELTCIQDNIKNI